jgi:hypothetical protein
MKKKIELSVECPSCSGTGLYQGLAEGYGIAVVCHRCQGTGEYKYSYSYNDFTGRKKLDNVERVFKKGTQYKIGLGVVDFGGEVGEIDMDKEGVSYQEFLDGILPNHIKQLECPMMADQGACHNIKGFTGKCNDLNGGWIGYIPSCKHQNRKNECWDRFSKI